MNQQEIRIFLSKLTNTELANDSLLTLSSAQKARLYNWCQENKVKINIQKINGIFSIDELVDKPIALNLKNKVFSHEHRNLSADGFLPTNIGIDIQVINELFPISLESDCKDRDDLKSIFTLRELSYAQSRVDMRQTLTGIFAAKEAILKCQHGEINLVDIEILPNKYGAPSFKNYLISISHSGEYAIAIAINNGPQNRQPLCPSAKSLPNFLKDEDSHKKRHFLFSRVRLLDLFIFAIILSIILFK